MRTLNRFNAYRIRHPLTGATGDAHNGAFRLPLLGQVFTIIASTGDDWEHVSVSLPDRTPTWDEMCEVKRLFFHGRETVIQYHPATDAYINLHNHCLHLWRPLHVAIPVPPIVQV